MECKSLSHKSTRPTRDQELIDTLWNVNTTYDVEDRETTWHELIDTLWNVNKTGFRISETS